MKNSILTDPVIETCRWRTGDRRCAVRVLGVGHCSWHQYWLRIVERGVPARSQQEEFFEWWQQFQPYGIYGDRPGLWWADKDVLWGALSGQVDMPVMTDVISRELILRRAEVRCYLSNKVWSSNPWPRLTGLPLPEWHAEEWNLKVNGSFHTTEQCG